MNLRLLIGMSILAAATVNTVAQIAFAAEVVPRSEVTFQPLNPARGDASPKAGVLWGDIRQDVPTGALIQFADGFSSPPHIHNITYRAVVISGAVHNDDANADEMWMGPGSFWTQPAGKNHITAARGNNTTAFLEILEGPYLVQPPVLVPPPIGSIDDSEQPVNIDASNVVWLDSSDVTWLDQNETSGAASRPEVAFLWGSTGEDQKNGTFLKLPAGFSGELRSNGAWLRAVVIQGQTSHRLSNNPTATVLEPGSYFGSKGDRVHAVSCEAGSECILYISTEGKYDVSG